VRLLRGLLLFKLGFWAGMVASATLLKRLLPSRGDEDSDEIQLVAVMNGIELESRSRAFRGGSMFSWLGGIAVDLREVELAENAHLEVHSAFGGVAIRVPTPDSPDAPTLRLDGFSAFGGVAVGAKPGSAAS
jgi:hypothetical protein